MRRLCLGLVVAALISAAGMEARAQVGGLNDPSFAYYALYLPRQAAQASAPGPEATINQFAAVRQQFAATNRNGMFDPNYSGNDSLESDPFGSSNPNARRKRGLNTLVNAKFGVHGGNLNGLGPQGYYNGTSLTKYYRDIRAGRGKNANVSVHTSRRGMGGYGGVGGLPGPR